LMLYGVVASLWLFPRVLGEARVGRDVAITFRWVSALVPSLFGFAAVCLGSGTWVGVIGILASGALLVVAAATTPRNLVDGD
jgi:hypothetical protein